MKNSRSDSFFFSAELSLLYGTRRNRETYNKYFIPIWKRAPSGRPFESSRVSSKNWQIRISYWFMQSRPGSTLPRCKTFNNSLFSQANTALAHWKCMKLENTYRSRRTDRDNDCVLVANLPNTINRIPIETFTDDRSPTEKAYTGF